MKTKYFVIFILLFFTTINSINAQANEWSFKPAISAYYTSLKLDRYSYTSNLNPNEKYFLNTTNLFLSLPLNEKFRIGIGLNVIATKVLREAVDRSFLSGVFFQYNFRARKKLGIYLESGYVLGNFCPCGDKESYSSTITNHFIPMGFGLHYPLFERVYIKAGFINYKPIKGHEERYNFTQPFIGVNVHFFKKYQIPFKSRFIKRDKVIPKKDRSLFVIAENKMKWNIGLSSAGISFTQHNSPASQTTPLRRYLEIALVPRINYWINQAILVGIQATYYRYEDNYDLHTPVANGMGLGAQFRLYPLSLKNTTEFRAIRIGKRGNWHFSPIVGVEFHVANFSWLEPQIAGKHWQYFDVQPHAGFVISYKHKFNLFWNVGPTIGILDIQKTTPINGIRIIGFEYNFIEKKK